MTEVPEEFLALLAHELRTPVAAIIGYHDLMNEGILGDVNPRVQEGLDRIRSSANQLLALVASLGESGVDDVRSLHIELDDEDPLEIVETVLTALDSEAKGRATNLSVESRPDPGVFHTDRERLHRALLLTLHAAIKNTAGGAIIMNTNADNHVFTCTLAGARLDPERDAIRNGSVAAATAAAMRLAMAAQALRPLNGTLTLEHDAGQASETCVTIRLPESARGD